MRKFLLITLLAMSQFLAAQERGKLTGLLTDKESNNEPLPFANVLIKGTDIGATTDFDGNYSIQVPAGTHTVQFSFLGYKTIEKSFTIKAGGTVTINQLMSAEEGVALDDVVIKTSSTKEKESALLLKQKNATVIVESIGAERLSKIGVSDAAAATTKISGVTKSEGSGDIYIRGLGDRYLSTTMNGLPIPSDDVANKNIDLGLFSTNIINNIGISKTYNTVGYSDQASGTVDITTKKYTKKGFSIGVSGGFNTAVMGLSSDFRNTLNMSDVTFGYHKKPFLLTDAIKYQGWDPSTSDNSTNYGVSFNAAYKFDIFGKELAIFATASHSKSFEYQEGEFRTYRANILDNAFPNLSYDPATALNDSPSVEQYITKINTTGYIRGDIKLNDNHKIGYNTLFVNTGRDNLYEQGRNGLGYVFDQQPQERGAFVRDQNYKQTIMFVNQLNGEHKLSENNKLTWAGGYNFVLAEEPNRIRNEAIIFSDSEVTYADVSDFSQRKSTQRIEDNEFNAYIVDEYSFGITESEYDDKPMKLNFGLNFRNKERAFSSQFVGVSTPGYTPGFPDSGFLVPTVDNISNTFTDLSNYNQAANPMLRVIEQLPDAYSADMTNMAAFTNLSFGLDNKLSGNFGLRFERNEVNIAWNVKNYQGPNGQARAGSLSREYNSVYPSLNLKYQLNDRNSVRFASSLTQTLPEFKEFAPFQYEEPTGRVIQGNPDLERSKVINLDAKWEFFPSRDELVSGTVFYKNIKDPINLALTRGSSGNFEFNNTGEKATVFGIELESRLNIIENEDEKSLLSANFNITKMWFNQDLYTNFQYSDVEESGLQGASDFITNASLSFNSRSEKEFTATVSGNYASDKIFALGSPEDLVNSATLFNDEIIEKGFVSLDLVLSKEITEDFIIKIVGRNLLNPDIQQTQKVTEFDNSGSGAINGVTDMVVQSYKRGSQLSVNFTYKF
ncbi:TonB-dependent receptor [Polaribacter reichenbachii]|uniref:TonB-dependent receptor n=1 Tax=Polaribacter reichenbachii TaxID=996801 RepID=A0A1B8U629_9FLAO|nr:TonB-dependent receptor [Polaribacter reichenbachii]APZ45996.1 TonB-dependent receptor [Polaribacter reichenbachii]AUC19858.1 TonB-dependent receptor [Polaribacter reichenbachii]OBY67287.1 TonB-dependent receptor [Polaribacter reichenbachii]